MRSDGVRGKSSTYSTKRGTLKSASRSRANATSAAGETVSTVSPGRSCTKAFTSSPRNSSGTGTTAHPITPGCSHRTASTSAAPTFSPPRRA